MYKASLERACGLPVWIRSLLGLQGNCGFGGSLLSGFLSHHCLKCQQCHLPHTESPSWVQLQAQHHSLTQGRAEGEREGRWHLPFGQGWLVSITPPTQGEAASVPTKLWAWHSLSLAPCSFGLDVRNSICGSPPPLDLDPLPLGSFCHSTQQGAGWAWTPLDSTRASHHGPFQVEVSIVHLLTSSLNPWLPSRQDKENPYSAQDGNMSQVPTSTEQTEQSCGASVCSLRVCFPHTHPWPPWAFVLRVGVTREPFPLWGFKIHATQNSFHLVFNVGEPKAASYVTLGAVTSKCKN